MDKNKLKKTLVFIHGYLGGSKQWSKQVAALSNTFYMITPDLPGYGLNNQMRSPESINGYVDYVLKELEQNGIERFYLVGHSMGGMIAQEIATRVPQRVEKLVLYGTGPLGNIPGRFESINESKQRLTKEGVESSAKHISATWFVEGKDCCSYQACADIAIQASHQVAVAGLTAMEAWSGMSLLAEISSLTLVLWGDKDKSYQWEMTEKLWQEIPNSNLSVVQGCSHAVHLEKPELFNAILLDFLLS